VSWLAATPPAPGRSTADGAMIRARRIGPDRAGLARGHDERAQLDKVSALPLIYPYWHRAKTARDRLSAADLALLAPYLD